MVHLAILILATIIVFCTAIAFWWLIIAALIVIAGIALHMAAPAVFCAVLLAIWMGSEFTKKPKANYRDRRHE